MDSEIDLYLKRAEDELILAKITFDISTKEEFKKIFNLEENKTFFNDVISEAYYGIFYAAKAYLLSKGIITLVPNEHKKTYKKFRGFVKSGKLDRQLIKIYEVEAEKADVLLNIFYDEKRKRGNFVYNLKSEANIPYAKESIENAKKFISLIKSVIENEK